MFVFSFNHFKPSMFSLIVVVVVMKYVDKMCSRFKRSDVIFEIAYIFTLVCD